MFYVELAPLGAILGPLKSDLGVFLLFRAPPTVVAVVTDNSYILGLIFLEMGFRFSARRTCNFQGQIRCDNIFPSRTLNCNSKLLTIKIKLAKESFAGLCFSKSFIIQIKSIYPLFTKFISCFAFPLKTYISFPIHTKKRIHIPKYHFLPFSQELFKRCTLMLYDG